MPELPAQLSHRLRISRRSVILLGVLAAGLLWLGYRPAVPVGGSIPGTRPQTIRESGRFFSLRLPGSDSASGSAAAFADETGIWPNLFGPRHNSTCRADTTPIEPWGESGPPVRWRLPCGAGYSSPVVWKDRLIIQQRVNDEEVIACLRTSDGTPLWEFRYPTTFLCGSHYTNGPYSTPAIDGDRVYTLGAQGQLHCLRLVDGGLLWSRNLHDEFQVAPDIFGAGHSPLCWDGRLILNVGGQLPDSGIVAFDCHSGEILWRSTHHGPSFATPCPAVIHGSQRLFVFTADGLSLLDPQNGRELWSIPFASKVSEMYNAVTPIVQDDLVMISAWGVGTKVLRIDPSGNWTEIWDSNRKLTSQYTPLIAVGGHVLGVHALDNSLRSMELDSGDIRWRWKSELGNIKPLAIGQQLVLFGEYGRLGLIDLDPHALRVRSVTANSLFPEEHRCYSAPAYAAGCLYVRNESEVICLNLAAGKRSAD